MDMAIEDVGRIRLSWSFFMDDMLHAVEVVGRGFPNTPDRLDLTIIAGRELATKVLEPLVASFGAVHIREGYLSPLLYEHLIERGETVDAERVWDRFDEGGRIQAGVTVVLPWLMDHDVPLPATEAMVAWVRSHLPVGDVETGDGQGAFKLVWREGAAPDPSQGAPNLFNSLGFPSLQTPKIDRRHDILPPI